jgi:tetratricopeptide (TPR) repeat protein
MSEAPAPNVSELAVAEIERRLQWRALPMVAFLAVLLLLLGVGFWPTLFPPPHIGGLPDDPDVFAAATQLRSHVVLPTAELRFESALTGDVMPGMSVQPDLERRLVDAGQSLAKARPRLAGDVRMRVARGALDLVRQRYTNAERHYHYVLDRYPNYPEARLGLGVTLALAGELERNPLARRQRYLAAIAQFAAVGPRDAEYEEALFDRVLLLERVGRRPQAARFAGEYLARGAFAGAERMRAIAGATR